MASNKNRRHRRVRQAVEDVLLVVFAGGALILLVTLLFR